MPGWSMPGLIQEKLVRKDDLAQFTQAAAISTPDPLLASTLRESGLAVFQVEAVSPEMIAALGWSKLQAGLVVSPEQLDANYIRRGAEIVSTSSMTSSTAVKIRPATPDDVPHLIELDRASGTAAHWSAEQYRDLFRNGFRTSEALAVAEGPDGSVIGFLVAQHVTPEWELENIVVSPPQRRKGIGNAFCRHCSKPSGKPVRSCSAGSSRVQRLRTMLLFEEQDFSRADVRKAYYSDPLEDAVLYRLSLR